ncbi:MAG: hypothetical protein FWG25_02595, partial [Promicromonosporaceae bacterium]|nr:hypothetical protein [Promicromonosporaceae bacterium]
WDWNPYTIAGEDGLGFASDYGVDRGEFDEIVDCRNWAGVQLELEMNLLAGNEEFATLMEGVSNLRESLRDDASPADRAWAMCMADKGYGMFERQIDASIQVNHEFNYLQSAILANWTPGQPGLADSPEMAELQVREIKLALADFDCRVSTGFAFAQQDYVLARETQFVNDNREALQALRHAAELGRLGD